MPTPRSEFVVRVDPSIKLTGRAKSDLSAAIGGAAAASLARLDLGGTPAFIPRIDWPGGLIVDLKKLLTPARVDQLIKGSRL